MTETTTDPTITLVSPSTEPPAPGRLTRLFNGDAFERFVAILIALVALLAAFIGFLQGDAGTRAAQANRNAHRFAIEAMGRQLSGAAQIGYDWSSAYQTWNELDTLALTAGYSEDDRAVARYETLRDRVQSLSPLLNPPYFDPDVQAAPDLAGYQADLYLVEATALAERYKAMAALDNAWGDKAKTYVTHLTLLAVSLFLFGLSITTGRLTRWLFLGAGLFITAVTLFWLLITLIWPVPYLSEPAIMAYAEGVGKLHRGDPEGAVAAFDQALAEAPDYGTAFYERGNAYYDLGNYVAAAADYEAARENGRDDINVAWNLGWTYYLLGEFEKAIETDRHGLELEAERIGLRFNLGLALLASGQAEVAQAEYDKGLDLARQQVTQAREAGQEPPSSLWWYLEAGALDLDSLTGRLNGQTRDWTEAPPAEAIVNPEPIQTLAGQLTRQIREMAVALEYTGQPPAGLVTAKISPLQFGQAVYDEAGEFVEYQLAETYPYLTNEVLILFDYEGMQDGLETTWKIYRDGLEDPSLRLVEEWSLGQSGTAEKPISFAYSNVFVFTPGEYTVELYVNSRLAQRGSFVIGTEE